MRRLALTLAVLLAWPAVALAQSDWAFSTLNLPHGTATPVSCKTGDVYGQTVPTAGLYFCNPDNTWTFSGGGGGGISNLNGLTDAAQTFAKVDDANVTLAISSVSPTHTFTMGWTGTLGLARGGTNADLSVGPCASCFVKTNPGGTALTAVSPPITATQGGTGITSVAQSGSVLFWDTTTTLAASATLTNHAMVVGGGAGGAPKTLAALTDGQLYIGSTGLDPVPASLIQGANITITPGAGSITIAATAAGTVTHTLGPLTLNAFVLGNGAADVKAQAITGLVVGAGASAPSGFAGSTCAAGQFASSISSVGSLSCAVPVSAAGGANTQVQFNNAGVLAGDSNLTWDNTAKALTLGGELIVNRTQSVAAFQNIADGGWFGNVTYRGKALGIFANQTGTTQTADADNAIFLNVYKGGGAASTDKGGIAVSHIGVGTGDDFYAQASPTATEWRDGLFRGDIFKSAPTSGGVGPGAVFFGNTFSGADASSVILLAREGRTTASSAGSLRWESSTLTSGNGFTMSHSTSAWNGDAFFINLAAGSGSFTGNAFHLAVSLSNIFLVDGLGDTTIAGGFSTGNATNPGSGAIRATGAIRSDAGFNVNGTAGTTHTYTMCASGPCNTTCTIITSGGVVVGGTC